MKWLQWTDFVWFGLVLVHLNLVVLQEEKNPSLQASRQWLLLMLAIWNLCFAHCHCIHSHVSMCPFNLVVLIQFPTKMLTFKLIWGCVCIVWFALGISTKLSNEECTLVNCILLRQLYTEQKWKKVKCQVLEHTLCTGKINLKSLKMRKGRWLAMVLNHYKLVFRLAVAYGWAMVIVTVPISFDSITYQTMLAQRHVCACNFVGNCNCWEAVNFMLLNGAKSKGIQAANILMHLGCVWL